MTQALRIVHILIPSKTAEHRLWQQADQSMAAVLPGTRIERFIRTMLGECAYGMVFENSDQRREALAARNRF